MPTLLCMKFKINVTAFELLQKESMFTVKI